MQGAYRGFREIDVSVGSSESGEKRYPPDSVSGNPAPQMWRNNLTALSQYFDLHFTAYGEELHVHRPQFPHQSLEKTGVYWELPVSSSALSRYRHGVCHTINHVTVGDLGIKEIVVCVCNDGDVIVYYTDVIRQAVEAVKHKTDLLGAIEKYVKPLMIQNVRKSAWGIAIHKNARMIAVSSNSYEISVFAFALERREAYDQEFDSSQPSMSSFLDGPQDQASHSAWVKNPSDDFRIAGTSGILDRQRDQIITLCGHSANIPSIAFCNTEADPTGQYLISTDIYGAVIVWNVWQHLAVQKILLGPYDPSIGSILGWSITCIQPRSLRLADTEEEFLGCKGRVITRGGWDITNSRASLRDPQPRRMDQSSSEDPTRRIVVVGSDQPPFHGQEELADAGDHLLPESQHGRLPSGDSSVLVPNELNFDIEMDELSSDEESEDDIDPRHSILPSGDDLAPRPMMSTDYPMTATLPDPSRSITSEQAYYDILMDSNNMSLHSYAKRAYRHNSRPHKRNLSCSNGQAQSRSGGQVPPPSDSETPFLIFHTGIDVVSLFQPPYSSLSAVCYNPCREHQHQTREVLEFMTPLERLSMTQYIPDLGTAIVGSPTGRVAIFTLTRKTVQAEGKRPEVTEFCAMRLDWVLPFHSQDVENKRPLTVLVGVAVSPLVVPGREFTDGVGSYGSRARHQSDRWRLVLTYADHTVLNYELWRGEKTAVVKSSELRF